MPTIHATRVGHKDEFKIVRAMPGVSPKDTMMPGRLVPLAMVDNVAAKDRFKEVAAGQSLEMRGTNTATAVLDPKNVSFSSEAHLYRTTSKISSRTEFVMDTVPELQDGWARHKTRFVNRTMLHSDRLRRESAFQLEKAIGIAADEPAPASPTMETRTLSKADSVEEGGSAALEKPASARNMQVIADKDTYEEEMQRHKRGIKPKRALITFLLGALFPPMLLLLFTPRYRETEHRKVQVLCQLGKMLLAFYIFATTLGAVMYAALEPMKEMNHIGQLENPDVNPFLNLTFGKRW